VALVGDAQRVGELVDERADAGVARVGGVDDDALGLGVAVAAQRAGQLLVADRVALLACESFECGQQMGVAVAGQWRPGWWRERDRVCPGDRVGL